MVGRGRELGVTDVNIKSGFRATGIWPMDSDIFQDIDYLPSSTTDRPISDSSPVVAEVEAAVGDDGIDASFDENSMDSFSQLINTSTPRTSTSSLYATLERLLPFLKAPPHKTLGTTVNFKK